MNLQLDLETLKDTLKDYHHKITGKMYEITGKGEISKELVDFETIKNDDEIKKALLECYIDYKPFRNNPKYYVEISISKFFIKARNVYLQPNSFLGKVKNNVIIKNKVQVVGEVEQVMSNNLTYSLRERMYKKYGEEYEKAGVIFYNKKIEHYRVLALQDTDKGRIEKYQRKQVRWNKGLEAFTEQMEEQSYSKEIEL